MTSHRFFRFGSQLAASILAVFSLILGGCVENRAYRDLDSRPWSHSPPTQPFVQGQQLPQYEPAGAAGSGQPYDLSYIEFDEQGDYWDRRQLGWTIEEIQRAARATNVVLVLYVHGWQNDASALPGHDVQKFHCLLERMSTTQHDGRRYFGVYIGWRGKSVPGGDGVFPPNSLRDRISQGIFLLPHELSIFDRQNDAIRVAGMPITEAIFSTIRAARTSARESGHLTKSILIGHSFGALVVEKALAQALSSEIILNDGASGAPFPAPADFIVLLNSAAQSIYAKEMMDFLRRRHPAADDEISAQHPLIVSVTSTADDATGVLFPIGTSISNATGTFRRYDWDTRYGQSSHDVDQRQYLTTTPGHNPFLVTHEAVPEGTPSLPVLDEYGGGQNNPLAGVARNLEDPLTGPGGKVRFVTINPENVPCYWTLEPTVPPGLETPYWIVHVPKTIMRDHSDIFNENSLALLARLFRLSNPDQRPGITMTTKPRTMRLTQPEVLPAKAAPGR